MTVETVTPFQETLRRGDNLTLTYKFSTTGPVSPAKTVFVHIIDSNGNIVLQDDHPPQPSTTKWKNTNASPVPDINYSRPSIVIPTSLAYGDYRVVVGLYDATNGRLTLAPGNRVNELSLGSKSYVVSYLTVTPRSIRNASFPCASVYSDPSTWPDVTTNINNDLAAIVSGTSSAPGEIYKLPKGGCRYSDVLRVGAKNHIDVVGAGIPDTVLHSTNRNGSSLVVFSGTNVTVRDMTIRTTKVAGNRIDHGDARGIYIDTSSAPAVKRVRVENVAGTGIAIYNTPNGSAQYNEIVENESDGIHVTGELSDNTLIQFNWAHGTGDDSYSSIGYGNNGPVRRTTISNNYSGYSRASGIAVEGTDTAVVQWNEVKYSAVAGMRIASIIGAGFTTGGVTNATVSNNLFEGVRTSCGVDHAAIMIFADLGNVSSTTFSNNTILDPRTAQGVRLRGSTTGTSPLVTGVTASNNTFTTSGQNSSCGAPFPSNLTQCIGIGPNTSSLLISGNRWNGSLTACNN